MSGGGWSYLYVRIEDGSHDMQAWDAELADLMRDLSEVRKACEWSDDEIEKTRARLALMIGETE